MGARGTLSRNPMSNKERFQAYAMAFEKAFESDDWTIVAPYFAEDAVYEVPGGPPFGGKHEGKAAILAAFKQALDGFDRRFDSRELELLEGPTTENGSVWLRWCATYRAGGLPNLRIEGEETADFENGCIKRLEDHIPESESERTLAFLGAHGSRLGLDHDD